MSENEAIASLVSGELIVVTKNENLFARSDMR